MSGYKITALLAIAGCIANCAGPTYHLAPGHVISPNDTPRNELGRDVRRVNGKVVDSRTLLNKFSAAYERSYDLENNRDAALALAGNGMTLIDLRCDLFFEQIGRGAQKGDFIRREFQSISAAIVATLGLTSVGQDAVTGAGIGTALGVQSLDNYSTVFFFSPDVSAVQKLVRRVLQQQRQQLMAPSNSPRTFNEAVGVLREYQNTCMAHEIKRLVTEAIDPDRPAVGRFGDAPSDYYVAVQDRLLSAFSERLFKDQRPAGTLTMEETVMASLLRGEPPLEAAQQDYACSSLSAPTRAKICEKAATEQQVETYKVIAEPADAAILDQAATTLAALRPDVWEKLRSAQRTTIIGGAAKYAASNKQLIAARQSGNATAKAVLEKEAEIRALQQRIRATTAQATGELEATPATTQPAEQSPEN